MKRYKAGEISAHSDAYLAYDVQQLASECLPAVEEACDRFTEEGSGHPWREAMHKLRAIVGEATAQETFPVITDEEKQ